ncbi:NAD(P)-binding oxidoreductase [Tetragenococcus solitarius]|uniref:SDR family oxidoreductase n=1 Tax=Tetragenococcus solitarius TaxID=71453 RepID=A0ABP6KMN5_9ENTE|nr:NAD(P)-binding oxidoreductase [Tetragenococcus solitarius]
MKVLVVGANGKVAKCFADLVQNHASIDEKAVIRNSEQKPFFEERGIETEILDIVYNSIEDFVQAMQDVDAVVFSAGAGGSGLDKTVMVDLDGAIKVMTAAEKANVKRFVMVSTFRTGRKQIAKGIENDWPLKIYTIAKNYADEWLKNRTDLDWTIIHPGTLTDEKGSGKIKVGMGNKHSEIPRQDVAQTILASLESDVTIHKEFEVLPGDEPINEAVKTV